jgi:hypothetical protein
MGTHSHNITDPGHQHGLLQGPYNGAGNNTPPGMDTRYGINAYTARAATGIVITPASAGTPGGAVSTTIEVTGSPTANTNIPPYYALCYIMKL